MRTTIIIPAFNEGARIKGVLRAVLGAGLVNEVIVVSDGSTDDTAKIAMSVPGVRVLELTKNLGKGGAMAAGVAATHAEIIGFVDADLAGLQGIHIDAILKPLIEGECDMCVGVFRGGKVGSNAAMAVTPFLSGQRALTRDLFDSIPYIGELRFGVEMAITSAVRKKKARVQRVILRGVSNAYKEEKLGIVRGLKARTRMYKEIREAMVKTRRRNRPTRRRWMDY